MNTVIGRPGDPVLVTMVQQEHQRPATPILPEGMDFGSLTTEAVVEIQEKLNSRPRKCIDYRTPNDMFRPPPPIALAA